jgi:diguanylate cyclase (GGDEF)-like protein/PAS domain S-box-containing protein
MLALTLSILFFAEWIGLIPDVHQAELEQRKMFSESLAVQFSSLARTDNLDHMRTTLQAIVDRNPMVLSAAFRALRDDRFIEAGTHSANWSLDSDGDVSTTDQVIVPIFKSDQRWGSVEVRFEPMEGVWLGGILGGSFIKLLAYVASVGFLLYFLFLKRVLKELDPSGAVPERVRAAFDSLAEGVLILDERGQIILANKAFSEKSSLNARKIIGTSAAKLNWSSYDKRTRLEAEKLPWSRVMTNGQSFTGEKLTIHQGAEIQRSYKVNCTPIHDAGNAVRGVITTFDDLTELDRKNEELRETLTELKQSKTEVDLKSQALEILATRDPLTNCLNRRAFNEAYTDLFDETVESGGELACMMVDIDHFKRVNDNYGHAVGDKVIKFVSEVLNKQVRQTDLLGRYGGEEFCVVLHGSTVEQAHAIAERMRLEIKGGDPSMFTSALNITASFGIASIHDEREDKDELVNKADKALYLAKESGRNKVVIWEDEGSDDYAMVHVLEQSASSIPGDGTDAEGEAQSSGELQDRIRQLEQIAAERAEQLDKYVAYDVLTELPARHLFMDRVEQALLRARRNNSVLAVLSLGLVNLGQVNDTLGYEYASALLRETASRLREVLRESDTISLMPEEEEETTISKLSDGEFGVLLSAVKDNESITWIVRRIFDSLQEPFYVSGQNLNLRCNIGIGVFPADGMDAPTLIQHASIARYYAEQQSGTDKVEYFSDRINQLSKKQLLLENELSKAIDNDEFEVHYQPKVDLDSGTIIGFESLIRWQHPVKGLLTPYEFIDTAERTRLINIIGEWVLRQSCFQILEFEKNSGRDLTIAVNLSPVQLSQTNLVQTILSIVEETGVNPRRLELELTENCLMENIETALDSLVELQNNGIKISIDDFGTGYSGLSYLRTLPINILKVDRCFIADIGSNDHDAAIVAAIVNMAKALDLIVVAEGVETREQLDALSKLHCHEAQGYLFSKPVPADKAQLLLQSQRECKDVSIG